MCRVRTPSGDGRGLRMRVRVRVRDLRRVSDTLPPSTLALADERGDRYKWTVLSNTTLGVLMATIDSSILLIALPDIFRGIGINPLLPGNTFYLLWMILSFLIVSSVLVVSLGRLGDMYGRVKMYNLGFAVYTFFSLLLSITWMSGSAAALYLIIMRIFQGVGAAFLIANSGALLTDAFPEDQRGMALGINQVAGISGSFLGLVLGGILGPIQWRLIFLVSVPVGLFATIWAYRKLHEVPVRRHGRIDWPGNITFALGLIALMVGVTYGIQPYGGHIMGWTSPFVLGCLAGGVALLIAFAIIETAGRGSHVPTRPLPDPRVHRRLPLDAAGRHRPRWPDVHPDHLAPGDLAAPPRLRLRPHPALGGHLHAPADGRLPHCRPDLGHPVRPFRLPTVCHRRDVGGRAHLRTARAPPG